MHGLGNDYILVDGTRDGWQGVADLPGLARAISDRHLGVGSDGLILILPGRDHPFRMRMFNADGSEGEMCGNGIRCFARYLYDYGLSKDRRQVIETKAGLIVTELVGDLVRVDMGEPRFERGQIPMTGPETAQVIEEQMATQGVAYRCTAVSMGNPHCVTFVDDISAVPLDQHGPLFEWHPAFPNRTNVEFVQVNNRYELTMRVWERGSGITMACGTGACAALVAAVRTGRCEREAVVHLDGGDLQIVWDKDEHVFMTGPATVICDGFFYLPGRERQRSV
ncbi:MAG TPA: diaminopimelate epimerase [Firmicutes bacterium]|jgi:diaminopimelate epimerase|nr:diaminopimelate epimerase [Bacillota bacterium]